MAEDGKTHWRGIDELIDPGRRNAGRLWRRCLRGAMGLTFFLFLQAAAGGQEPQPPPTPAGPAVVAEPEYEAVFFVLDPETGALSELERVEGMVKERAGGGLAMERYVELPGSRSQVRIPSGHRPEIVVRVPSQGKDPQSLISLFAVQPLGLTRALPLAKVKLSRRVERLPLARVPIEAEKYGTSSFKLRPASLSRPGEYCFTAAELTRFFFCFGAD